MVGGVGELVGSIGLPLSGGNIGAISPIYDQATHLPMVHRE